MCVIPPGSWNVQGGRINTPAQPNWTTYTLPISYTTYFTPVAVMGVTTGLANVYVVGVDRINYKALPAGQWTGNEPLFFITIGK